MSYDCTMTGKDFKQKWMILLHLYQLVPVLTIQGTAQGLTCSHVTTRSFIPVLTGEEPGFDN